MTDDFKPPIKSRTTDELLTIVGAPKKWNERAVKLALDELHYRKTDAKLIEQAYTIEIQNVEAEASRKATESYQISDFILRPSRTILELLFTWELKKDGYTLKAQQQKTFRIALIIIIFFVFLLIEIT